MTEHTFSTTEIMTLQLKYAKLFWVSPKYWRVMSRYLAMTHILCCILQLLSLVENISDVQAAMDCFSVLSFCFVGFLKYNALRKNQKHIRRIINEVQKLESNCTKKITAYEYETDGGEDETVSSNIKVYLKDMNLMYKFLPRIYISTLSIFMLAPFAEHLILGPQNGNLYPHILPTWFPFKETFSRYVFIVMLEAVSAMYCVMVHLTYDLTCLNLMKFVSGQYKILRKGMMRIAGGGRDCVPTHRRDARAFTRIIKCHHQHEAVTNLAEQLSEYILQPVMGAYITIATLSLCAIAIQLSSVNGLQLLSLIQYMTSTLLQLYLFCGHADAVLQESDTRLYSGAFGSSWWCLSPKRRKDLTILGAITSRPRVLKAGLFHVLNLPAFMAIVQTAYSYYAVLSKSR